MTESRMIRRLAPLVPDVARVADGARALVDLTGRALLFLGLTGGMFMAFLGLLGSF